VHNVKEGSIANATGNAEPKSQMLQVDCFVAFDTDAALKKATLPILLATQSQITNTTGNAEPNHQSCWLIGFFWDVASGTTGKAEPINNAAG